MLKALTGKAGPAGKSGVNGVSGTQGAQGPAGAAGGKGETGSQGPAGPTGPQGPAGINGTTGFVKTLPKGESLKGEWSLAGVASAASQLFETSVTYAFPLGSAPIVHYISPGEELAPLGCTGSFEEPGAEEGNLCVFGSTQLNSSGHPSIVDTFTGAIEAASPYGFSVGALSAAGGQLVARGTWAVTAE